MSGDRAVVERLYAALAAGDRAGIDAVVADDLVAHLTPGLPFGIGGEHRGAADQIENGWFAIGCHWRVRAVPESWSAGHDGRLLVRGRYVGVGRRSGLPLDTAFHHLWTVREGRIVELEQWTDAAAFVQALGVEAPLATIDLTVDDDGVATLLLDRSQRRNAIDQRLADDLLAAALRVGADPRVRAVLIAGRGEALTVGGDLPYVAEQSGDGLGAMPDVLTRMTTPFHLAFDALDAVRAPIVTVAHGAVAGGGLGLVYAGDLVVASSDARFVTAFAALGLTGDGGGTWHLPRRIGAVRAAEAYLRNRPITADEALAWGLVNELAADRDAAVDRGRALAGELAQGPSAAFGGMRRLLRDSWSRDAAAQRSAEGAAIAQAARTADARGAVSAFLTKQRPRFEGA